MYAMRASVAPGSVYFDAPTFVWSSNVGERELTGLEVEFVSGGLTTGEAGQIAALFATGSAIAGVTALGAASLGPLGAPAAFAGGVVSVGFGLIAAGFGLYAAYG